MQTAHPTMDRLFDDWSETLGQDLVPYRNHAYRVFNLALALVDARGEEVDKLAVAAAFHDVAIWLDQTFDYLKPSVARASAYLAQHDRELWIDDVTAIIEQHHKVTRWRGPGHHLVEGFRRADWLDVSLFTLPTKLPRRLLADLLGEFPRAGFHRRLVSLTLSWARKHPFRPLPMFRW